MKLFRTKAFFRSSSLITENKRASKAIRGVNVADYSERYPPITTFWSGLVPWSTNRGRKIEMSPNTTHAINNFASSPHEAVLSIVCKFVPCK